MFTNKITLVPIHSDDEELFRNFREIWDKITELIGINNPTDFVETTLYDDDDDDDDDEDEFIMLEIEKNKSAVRYKYRNDLAFFSFCY